MKIADSTSQLPSILPGRVTRRGIPFTLAASVSVPGQGT